MRPVRPVDLKKVAHEVLAYLAAHRRKYLGTSRLVIPDLCARARSRNDGCSRRDFFTPRSPRAILVKVRVQRKRFRAGIVDVLTDSLMRVYDSDPRVIGHQIIAERRRRRSAVLGKGDHAGIHLYVPRGDQVVFLPAGNLQFDVHFSTDPDYDSKTIHTSPFDAVKLECRAGIPVCTGPVRERDGQRYFKYTIVSPGEKPGTHKPGKPIHLDPHMLDHDDPSDE